VPGDASLLIAAGTRVQISYLLLEPGERADGIPADTAELPYVARVRGVLVAPAAAGGRATVRTPSGRERSGELELIEPAYTHSFGRPPTALVELAEAVRRLRDEL
jgi:hypothetical protein